MSQDELHLVLDCDEILDVQWCIQHAKENGDVEWQRRCQNLLDKVKEAQLNWIK